MRTDQAASGGGNQDIWLHEFARAATTRFTFDPALEMGGSMVSGRQPRRFQLPTRRQELFYTSPDSKMMAVDVSLSPTFKAGIPKVLFPAPIWGGGANINVTPCDVTADGQRFLINAVSAEGNAGGASSPITVVLNWQAGLKK
jgi:hypothetical protein